jgi:hypothetical protein
MRRWIAGDRSCSQRQSRSLMSERGGNEDWARGRQLNQTGNPSPPGGWAGVPVQRSFHRGSVTGRPLTIVGKIIILSGLKRWHRGLCTLFSVEALQELAKGLRTGPVGSPFRCIVVGPQSNRQRLAVTINFPSPSPRTGVRLVHHDMIFRDRLHATIVRHCGRVCQATLEAEVPL